jgi:hypothetical protein
VSHPDPKRAARLEGLINVQVRFFRRFESVMGWLESVAKKELSATPLTKDERAFLKRVIDIRGGGSGPPRYDGWYPGLISDDSPALYKPTIADVHTFPGANGAPPKVLETGTGSVDFLVVAIDNEKDRAIYVGPVYSYYELTVPPDGRLTDEAWMAELQAKAPPRPTWTSVFQPAPSPRQLDAHPSQGERYKRPTKAEESKTQTLREQQRALYEQRKAATTPKDKERIDGALQDLTNQLMRQGGTCRCPPGDMDCPC